MIASVTTQAELEPPIARTAHSHNHTSMSITSCATSLAVFLADLRCLSAVFLDWMRVFISAMSDANRNDSKAVDEVAKRVLCSFSIGADVLIFYALPCYRQRAVSRHGSTCRYARCSALSALPIRASLFIAFQSPITSQYPFLLAPCRINLLSSFSFAIIL